MFDFGRLLGDDDDPDSAATQLERLVRDGTLVWSQLIEIDSGYGVLKALGALDSAALKGALVAAVIHEKVVGGMPREQIIAWQRRDVPPEARPPGE
jgi:hypothetical protein